jgi:hypothetical protein
MFIRCHSTLRQKKKTERMLRRVRPGERLGFVRRHLKRYLDWLFIRGGNLISPHAFYYSIQDDRRDERPPDVGPNKRERRGCGRACANRISALGNRQAAV